MPAITVDDTLVLPRIPRPDPVTTTPRPVAKVVTARSQSEGAGFTVRRPFPGDLSLREADPFLLLDHAGPAAVASMNALNGWKAQIRGRPSSRPLPPKSVSEPEG